MTFITEFLIRDHKRLDAIFLEYKMKKNIDFKSAKILFLNFKRDLERHMMWEDEVISPAIDESIGTLTKPQLGTKEEHKVLKKYLKKIEDKLEEQDIDATLDSLEDELLNILHRHNRKEEDILYPWADNILSEFESIEVIEKMKSFMH